LNFMSLAIMDGANRKIYRSIRSTYARSLKNASRITGAWVLLAGLHTARLAALLLALVVYLKFISSFINISNEVIIAAAAIISLIWLLIGVLQYSFVPYVALFEPQLLLHDTFAKSKRLANNASAVFMISGIMLLSLYLFTLYRLCIYVNHWVGIGSNLLFVVGLVAAVVVTNGAMVMLYRKRRLARTIKSK